MSLEAAIARLTEVMEENNTLLRHQARLAPTEPPAPENTVSEQASEPADLHASEDLSAPESVQESEPTSSDASEEENASASEPESEPEIVTWYHSPDEQRVWSESGTPKRRRGVYKVDAATAEKLQAKYASEGEAAPEPEAAAPEAPAAPELGDTPADPPYDESQPMDDDTWGIEWAVWGKQAMRHADTDGDKAAAENRMKRFLLPLVREFLPEGSAPKIGDIAPEDRARFLNKAQAFFTE